MNKFIKKTLSLVLAVAMVLSFAPMVESKAAGDLDGHIVILHTNDVHGAIDQYAKIAAYKKELQARGAYVLLMDAGDFAQGDVHVSEYKGSTAVELMNLAGYDVATIGNHEFDYGFTNLERLRRSMKFKLVCSTLTRNGSTVFDANTIFTAPDGTKIGVFGLNTPESQTKANPTLIQGLNFASGAGLVDVAKAQVAALENAGCDIIVCLAHLGIDVESKGNRSIDVAKQVPGIDFMIDGHSHSTLDDILALEKAEGSTDTVITSTGTKLKNIGVVEIVMEEDGYNSETNVISTDSVSGSDSAVAARAEAINKEIEANYGAVFAKTEVNLNGIKEEVRTQETNLGDLICDAMIWKCQTEGEKVDVAMTNGGGIRASIPVGDIKKADIKTVLPFGNTLYIVKVTGNQLLEALEASTYSLPETIGGFPQVAGVQYTVNTGVPYDTGDAYPSSTYNRPKSIKRVSIQSVGGAPFDPNKTYTLAVNDFMAGGGDTYYVLKAATTKYDLGFDLAEVVMEYVQKDMGGVVGSKYANPAGNIKVVSQPVAEAPTPAPSPTPAPAPAPTPAPTQGGKYVVKSGDTLWKIAKEHYNNGNKYTLIVKANNIKNASKIYPGQEFVIPAA